MHTTTHNWETEKNVPEAPTVDCPHQLGHRGGIVPPVLSTITDVDQATREQEQEQEAAIFHHLLNPSLDTPSSC